MHQNDKILNKQKWIQENRWFHSIDFGDGCISPPRHQGKPPNHTLYGVLYFLEHIDVAGKVCLDIGTQDGLIAFILKRLGAERVIASDLISRPTVEFGKTELGLDIEYIVPIRINDLEESLPGTKLDLIVNAGVLYHVIDPLGSIIQCRKLLKHGGLMIIESLYRFDESVSCMHFNPNKNTFWGPYLHNIFWVPSLNAFKGMLEISGFEVLGYAASNDRIAFLVKAIRPSETKSNNRIIFELLNGSGNKQSPGYYEDFYFEDYEIVSENTQSDITCKVVDKSRWIMPSFFSTKLPLQPEWTPTHLLNKYSQIIYDLIILTGYMKARFISIIRNMLGWQR